MEIEKILSTKTKILMTTSGNVTKGLKIKQEMYMITKARLIIEAIIKQIAA